MFGELGHQTINIVVRISIACTIPSQGTQMVQNLKREKCYLRLLRSCLAMIALDTSVMMLHGIPAVVKKRGIVVNATWKRTR